MTEEKERVANYRCVYVTEITDALHFYTQDVETGERRRDLPEPSPVGKPPRHASSEFAESRESFRSPASRRNVKRYSLPLFSQGSLLILMYLTLSCTALNLQYRFNSDSLVLHLKLHFKLKNIYS